MLKLEYIMLLGMDGLSSGSNVSEGHLYDTVCIFMHPIWTRWDCGALIRMGRNSMGRIRNPIVQRA